MMLHENVSRAEVYSAIVKFHEELSKIPIQPESFGAPEQMTSPSGHKGAPQPRPGASSRTHREEELQVLLEPILVAFHPNSLPPVPSAECILECYPPNPAFFRSLRTLRQDTRDSDADRISRVISHNNVQIEKLRQTFSELMKQIIEENDRERQAAMIGYMERLGVEWGISEARIQTVTVWFQDRWRKYQASW